MPTTDQSMLDKGGGQSSASTKFNIDVVPCFKNLKKRTKRQKIVEARKIIVVLSKMYTNKSNKEIAAYLNISESNVLIILASSE